MIELHYAPTPNGWKITIMLEEIGLAYKIIPIKWNQRKKGKAKFIVNELGAKYLFTLIYCFLEKILLKK